MAQHPFDDFDSGPEEGGLDLKRWIGALRRRRKLIVILIALGLPVAFTVPFLQKPTYVATATLAIQQSPDVMNLGRDFMPRVAGRATPLARAEAVVVSDRVLAQVVDGMPRPGAEPDSLYTRSRALARRALVAVGLKDPLPPQPDELLIQKAYIDGLRGSIKIEADGAGSILSITAYAGSAGRAAWTANEIAKAFVAYEQTERRDASQAALNWLSEKTAELRDRIRRKEEAVAGLAPLGDRGGKAATEQARVKRVAELEAARLELLATEQRMAQLGPHVRTPAPVDDAQLRELRRHHEASRGALEAARLRYTETHPEVRRLREIVASLEGKVGDSPGTEGDPLREDRVREHRELQGERGRLQARVKALQGSLAMMGTAEDDPNRDLLAEHDRLDRELRIDRDMLAVLMQRRNETIVQAANNAPKARILDYAVPPLNPEPLRRLVFFGAALAAVAGLGFGVALGLEFLDPRLYESDDVVDLLRAPVLQKIPVVQNDTAPELQSDGESQSLVAESYRNLRTSILFAAGSQRLRSILVTSAVAGEGKTTCSLNLASSFAQTGRKVLLVDADLRRPRQHRVLGLSREPGLTDVLERQAKVSDVIRRPQGQVFDLITAGRVVANPVDVLGSAQLDLALARLSELYDLVIFDAPVLLAVSDALVLAARVDGVLFVSKPGSVDRSALERVQQDLARAQANLLGIAVTHVDPTDRYVYPSYLYSPYVEEGQEQPRRSRIAGLLRR